MKDIIIGMIAFTAALAILVMALTHEHKLKPVEFIQQLKDQGLPIKQADTNRACFRASAQVEYYIRPLIAQHEFIELVTWDDTTIKSCRICLFRKFNEVK